MDALDREILSLLQDDGRMSATHLASQVGLSLSACHRRLKELEQSGAIERYRAVVAPAAVGLTFEAIVFVTIGRTDKDTIVAFEEAVVAIPAVVEAQRLFLRIAGDAGIVGRVDRRVLEQVVEPVELQHVPEERAHRRLHLLQNRHG